MTMTANGNGAGRVAPHNLQAEESLLGAALLTAEALEVLVTRTNPEDFYRPVHGHIAAALVRAYEQGWKADPVTIADELGRQGLLDDVGGLGALLSLQVNTPATSNAGRYAEIIHSHAASRRILGAVGEITEAVYAGGDPTTVLQDALTKLDPPATSAGPMTAARLRSMLVAGDAIANLPPPEPLIDGLLQRNSLAALYGRSGGGKSFLAVDWALCVATGSWWFGKKVHPGRVLYLAAEGAVGMGDRVEAWKSYRGVYTAGDIIWLPVAVDLLEPAAARALATVASELQPVLVVVDTLNRSMPGGDENKSGDMGRLVAAADNIRAATGACVLIVHHVGKAADAGLRGHSSLEAALETSIELKTTDEVIEVQIAKQRNAPGGDKIRLQRVNVGTSCALDLYRGEVDSDDLPQTAVDLLVALAEIDTGSGVATGLWEDTVSLPRRTFYRWRKRLLDLGLVAASSDDARARWSLTDDGHATLEPAPTSPAEPF